jgi:hypothetical protein
MLNGGGERAPEPLYLAAAAMGDRNGDASLDLTPEDIVIHVDVDAHFLAD